MFKVSLTTKTMSYMAMFAACQLVLEFLTKFTPQMPQGGNVAFSLIALILCSYLMGPGYGLIVALVCTGLQFVLSLATFYGPVSVIFDYLLPMSLIGLCACFKNIHDFPVGIVIMMILKTISHLISGYFAFQTPLLGNIAYNLPYNIGTLIACFILYLLLYPRLKKAIKI